MPNLRVFIADDHPVIREGLKLLIGTEPDMTVVGEACDGLEACAIAAATLPDVIVMDLSMPNLSGSEAAERLKQQLPNVKILGLTMYRDEKHARDFLAAGATGYVLKQVAAQELAVAIRAVSAGNVYIDAHVADAIMVGKSTARPGAMPELSPREIAVMKAIAEGYSMKEIAAQMSLSVKSVETYKARGMCKLSLKSRVDLMRLAVASGWITDDIA